MCAAAHVEAGVGGNGKRGELEEEFREQVV